MSFSRSIGLSVAVLSFALMLASPARAASRTFTATLEKVSACTTAAPAGSATLTIDDVSGAVSGSLTLSGFDVSTIASSGIHNKNAGDNLVGAFDGVDVAAPNKTHAVTTTLNAIALGKILSGDGAIIVKSSVTGCGPGAARGDLVENGALDAGADGATSSSSSSGATSSSSSSGATSSSSSGGGTTSSSSSGGATSSSSSGGATSGTPDVPTDGGNDDGCSLSPTTSASGALPLGVALIVACRLRRKRGLGSKRNDSAA